jgi:thiosulfate dehydrogenase [quinone] large subunit
MNIEKIAYLKLRFIMSFIFLWAFLDKTFGLGFATKPQSAWVRGGSPTTYFLSNVVKGPFAYLFHVLSGLPLVDWLFMGGLLFVGLTLLFNKFVVWGAIAGICMLLFMWLSLLFPDNNPIIDEHVVYMLVLTLLAVQAKKGNLSFSR